MEEHIAVCDTRSGVDNHRHGRRYNGQLRMRTITLIIVHCSANKEGSTLREADIDSYHRSLGWKGCGYHWVIPTDGTIEAGRPEAQTGAHCVRHNRHSIGVCYVGGLDADGVTPKDTRTPEQKAALRRLIAELRQRYPKALVVGHHTLDGRKACPCFDVEREMLEEGVAEQEGIAAGGETLLLAR